MMYCRDCMSVWSNPYEITESFGESMCPICQLRDGVDIDPGVVVMIEDRYYRDGWMLESDWNKKSLEDKQEYIFRKGRLLENKS